MAQDQSYDDIPTISKTTSVSSKREPHISDQIRRWELALMAGIEKSLQETAEFADKTGEQLYAAGETAAGAATGNKADQAKVAQAAVAAAQALENMPETAEKIYQAVTNPALYEALEAGLSNQKEVLQAAYDRGDIEAVGMIVGAGMTDLIGPGKGKGAKKALEEAADMVDDAGDATKASKVLEGELVDSNAGNNLQLTDSTRQALGDVELPLGIKGKALDVAEKIPVIGELIAPPLDVRIARRAFKDKPNIVSQLDERHRIGGDLDLMNALAHDKTSRAGVLAEQARKNPDAAKKLNRHMTEQDISDLLKNTSNEQLGLPVNSKAVPKLNSASEQVVIDGQLEELAAGKQALVDHDAYLATLSPVQRFKVKLYEDTFAEDGLSGIVSTYVQPISAARKSRATDLDSEQLKIMADVGLKSVVKVIAVAGSGAYLVTRDWGSEAEKNTDLANGFMRAVGDGPEGLKVLAEEYKAFGNAVAQYQLIERHLSRDGTLDAKDKLALQAVADNIAKQIRDPEQGLESFKPVGKLDQVSPLDQFYNDSTMSQDPEL